VVTISILSAAGSAARRPLPWRRAPGQRPRPGYAGALGEQQADLVVIARYLAQRGPALADIQERGVQGGDADRPGGRQGRWQGPAGAAAGASECMRAHPRQPRDLWAASNSLHFDPGDRCGMGWANQERFAWPAVRIAGHELCAAEPRAPYSRLGGRRT